MNYITYQLEEQFKERAKLEKQIRENMQRLGYGGQSISA
jgi:hypothetical protein